MHVKFMDPKDAINMLELASKPYRPAQIVQLKEEIEGRIRGAELRLSITGEIDEDQMQEIVNMKLRLDQLYALWAQGELDGEPSRVIIHP